MGFNPVQALDTGLAREAQGHGAISRAPRPEPRIRVIGHGGLTKTQA
jgi:hypothetical protein